MKQKLSLVFLSFICATALAQKTVYVPNEWRNPWNPDTLLYKESDPDGKYTWSKTRSVESDNVIVFWDKGYGKTLPSKSASAYRVDEQDLLKKCEAFFDLEINKLGFVDPVKSNLAKYKVMVLLNHTTEWVCYGGGYDYMVSALWLGPSACKPVGHSVAHEVGHSFHYMCYAEHSGHKDSSTDNTGFHLACGNGQAIWEQTAQWQAAQSYPELMFDQSIGVFRKSHNYAFSHEWHRYQSYWFHYFINQYYNDITTVAQVWNTPMTGQSSGNGTDFNQALMALKGLDATGLFRLYYEYAARCATWDIDACRSYGKPYIGDFDYQCVLTGDKQYQVALSSTPQSSGFNVIPLQVPTAGSEIITHFTAMRTGAKLADGDPAEMMGGETAWTKTSRTTYINNTNRANRGFRVGYVALMKNGTRQYFNADSVYCKGTSEVTEDVAMTVPEDVDRLWLIVVPAPKKYVQHKWTEKADNAEQWPYRFQLEGTDIASRASVYVASVIDGREVSDITLTYDVNLPQLNSYDAVAVNVSGQAQALLGTAFQLQIADIAGKMVSYSSAGPAVGKIMFYPLDPKTLDIEKSGSTANGYGHWFNSSGEVCNWNNGYLYSEFSPSSLAFNIGQYPNRVKQGSDYVIGQALRYKQATGKEAIARFIFRIHITNSEYGAELSDIQYDDPTGILETNKGKKVEGNAVYDLQGRKVGSTARHGVYVINGRKVRR
ncbi:MAG: DUF4859 domain-containing protein [Prevotella sp.]|jgi:hypothetical protein|nr:DUF4859 domain-containing protein [Prevotella sp.]